ncbi:5-oxoprolinase subunit C family protein [Pontimicrobium aquaticum]|uniref:Biotin-dependent carboxyltransferase family protein n=1 Tax=Pontimicrobium aquaticum TaxID=2565367 RepID=A0A4U0EQD5_9FLAO|nr:biotin-dependent carboxyltransferase family protein [Pontimicrobium aquaticum]TJY33915.1 biotin-dependent carboxyltransferase family protein [Pontimicrobium aquaticum]
MIKVIHPGFYSTIQDLGRKDFQHLGVPISGVMDVYAGKMANAILGNDENCAVLEITMLGPKLEFCCDTAIVITGANLSPSLANTIINNNTLVNVNKGEVLSFNKPINGFRVYLAVSGGFQSEIVLNSRSMYQGITKAISVKKGGVLKIQPKNHRSKAYSSIKIRTDYLNEKTISVYKGPEFKLLNNEQMDKLFNQEFTISKENNRMAYQLDELIINDLSGIITSLVLPGTVQLTPSGKLIVLMRDCQTTGGYPRVLQLSESAINTLAQKCTGNRIIFKLIS